MNHSKEAGISGNCAEGSNARENYKSFAKQYMSRGMWIELYVYIGGKIIGGESAPTIEDGQGFRESFPRLRLDSLKRNDSITAHDSRHRG